MVAAAGSDAARMAVNTSACSGVFCSISMINVSEMLSMSASAANTSLTQPLLGGHLQPKVADVSTALLELGVLTTPRPYHHDMKRMYHRAAHYAQASVAVGRVRLRYLLTERELSTEVRLIRIENQTFGDMLAVPTVPHGLPFEQLKAPAGAGCVAKVLSWLQLATTQLRAPWVAYGDDDTFFALWRFDELLTALAHQAAFNPQAQSLYAGAMQYHVFWSFRLMQRKGWTFYFPDAWDLFTIDAEARAQMRNSSRSVRRLTHPYAMAHGMGTLMSAHLARQLCKSAVVDSFLRSYQMFVVCGHHQRVVHEDARPCSHTLAHVHTRSPPICTHVLIPAHIPAHPC